MSSSYFPKLSSPSCLKLFSSYFCLHQVARGKEINKVIENINSTESDISKFCYEQIFNSLGNESKKVLYTISLLNSTPTASIIQYVIDIEEELFEDIIEELVLCSFIIPEQFQNEKKEIITKYTLLPLTKGYTRIQLNKNIEIREAINARINQVESSVTTSERAAKEYRYSLYNFGAKTDEEKIATIIAQTAFQKYQSGNYAEAVEEYKRAIKVAPQFSPIFRNWAIMESYENHLSEATKLMEQAAILDPTDPQIYLIWGNIYRKSRKDLDAQKKYAIAYSIAPNDPIVLNAYGQSKSFLGEHEEANILLQKAIQPDSTFSSLKHEIINRTSIAENYIGWGDFHKRDRNFGAAELKYQEAIKECEKILRINTKDIKVYDTVTRACLKIGLLYLRERNESKAIQYLHQVIDYPNKTYKQGKLKLTAIAELGIYFIENNKHFELKKIIDTYNGQFKHTQILKAPENIYLREKISKMLDYFDSTITALGFIRSVNVNRGFVIIEEYNTKKTFFGHFNNFNPKIERISISLRGQEVTFQPIDTEDKCEAQSIKIVGANNRLLPSPPKRRT